MQSASWQKKGFSLLEILVVIGIIGILVLSTLPNYRHLVSSWQAESAKISLMQAELKLKKWAIAHGDYLGASPSTLGITKNENYKLNLKILGPEQYQLNAQNKSTGKIIMLDEL